MPAAWLQRVGTATPRHDVHHAFIAYARTLLRSERDRLLFDRMAERCGIAHRYSVLRPGVLQDGEVDAGGFYRPGEFPGTSARMQRYETEALTLALHAVHALAPPDLLAARLARVTHLVVASCTGFMAPGLDVQLVDALGLQPGVQRTMVGFMGCSAALPALRTAAHAVRAEQDALALVINLELCSLHLHEHHELPELLSFLLFGDAASAALVGPEPQGAELLDFQSRLLPDSRELITWHIGDQGFDMHLSGLVPGRIAAALAAERENRDPTSLLRGRAPEDYALWAVHAGGRTVLDAVQHGLALPPAALADSRAVLQAVGNVSSATVMFALRRMVSAPQPGALGLALAFGPGLSAESMRFRMAGLS
jgi:predicted naringenin-chalcone synthase